ncbi:MAG TPA: hypothetical protein DHW49_04470 [Anaerolineae bacterium]|nr:hypothetical protein [Anaerolineae bacterium]
MQNNISNEETKIITWQIRAFIIAVVTFVVSVILSRVVFQTTIKYAVLLTILPIFYIALSSIKNRISVIRLRGQKEYSRGQKAVLFGIALLVIEVATFIFFLTPLSDKYLNF